MMTQRPSFFTTRIVTVSPIRSLAPQADPQRKARRSPTGRKSSPEIAKDSGSFLFPWKVPAYRAEAKH